MIYFTSNSTSEKMKGFVSFINSIYIPFYYIIQNNNARPVQFYFQFHLSIFTSILLLKDHFINLLRAVVFPSIEDLALIGSSYWPKSEGRR